MHEIKCVQGSDEWFEARKGKITGSRFPILMPSTKQKIDSWNKTQLTMLRQCAAEILTGEREETFQSKEMERGSLMESHSREFYQIERMEIVRECGFYEYSAYVGASPDGMIGETKTWETKSPTSKNHLKYLLDPEELYKEYKWQTIGEMLCSDCKEGVICSYDPRFDESKQLVIYEISPSDKDFELLKERLEYAVELIKEWIQ